MGPLFCHGVSCDFKQSWGFALANFVGVWLGCVHAWFCICVPYVLALGFVKCWLDVWVDSVFGLGLGQSCGLTRCLAFALANFVVVVWVGVVHGCL